MTNLNTLDWAQLLDRLSGFATSHIVKTRLTRLEPLKSAEDCSKSFGQVAEAESVLSKKPRPFMESLDLFETWYQRLKKQATLKILELKDVRHFCLEVMALRETLIGPTSQWVTRARSGLMNAEEPLSAIDHVISPEGEIRADASEKLFQLYKEKSELVKGIQKTLDRTVKAHEMESILQDKYVTNREGRWVLPIRSGMQHVFDGIIHASSQSKQTVFMEPTDVIPLNNRLREVEVEIENEIERILTELSTYLYSQIVGIEDSRHFLEDSDFVFAKAQLSTQLEAHSIEFSENEIFLNRVRHPLLMLNRKQNEIVIPNTVEMNATDRVLLLSGPNAGGKTVLLKSIGLAAQMARCGLPIAAEKGSKIPFFREIYTSVGDAQSVGAHLSTFAAHLQILNEAAKASGSDNLLLIDEICGSTDPEEGSAIARAFIESYAQNGVYGVMTSHLSPLKVGWGKDSGVVNGSLEYDLNSGRPTYHFIKGVPGQSLAIKTAKRVGVSDAIVKRAMEFLSPTSKAYQATLDELETMKEDLRSLRELTREEQSAMEKEKKKYSDLLENLEREKDVVIRKTLKEAEKKIEDLMDMAKADEVFRKHENLAKVKSQLPEIVKAPSGAALQKMDRKIESVEEFTRRFPPGTRAYVPSLGRDAVIQGEPSSKGEVPVLSNSMRISVMWSEIKPPQQSPNPTAQIVRQTKGYNVSPADQDRTIDLRGLSVEEALEQLETQLDVAALNAEDRVKVIHGHGTEALKKSVRSYMSRSVYVKKWQAGTPDSGGDGVTWVMLKE